MRRSTFRMGLAFFAVVVLATTGCGPMLYAANAGRADSALEEARASGAQNVAPFEFYYAEANLHKSREDAGEAAYQDAIRYARRARAHADLALEQTRTSGRGASR